MGRAALREAFYRQSAEDWAAPAVSRDFCQVSTGGVEGSTRWGVALPKGVQVARVSDWMEGSGCYLLDRAGEPVWDKKLLEEYRKKEMGKRIWEHTQEVFERVLGKV